VTLAPVAASPARERAPNNLPQPLTSFIGREREIAALKERLVGSRLLTLTGTGGTGKTRLALQVAGELLEEYPDGVWQVELAALSDAGLVPQEVARVLGVREAPGRLLLETLADFRRSERALLVLDNCEHLVAACADLAHALLRACSGVRLLVTSRQALDVPGETLFRVPSLALPLPPPLPLDQLTQYEAVRLFIDRALLSQPSFAVTNQNAPSVAAICHRLEGIPLALELAAARVKLLSVEQIMARLEDRFRLLTGGSRTVLPRQQTLRAAIDWSYDLLTEPERTLLQRLSVFAGGFTLEAAEAVCAGEALEVFEVLDLLGQLADKSLVQVEEEGSEARYRLLETIRQYGAEKLQTVGEEAALRKRHRDWYLAMAEQAEPELQGRAQGEWLDRLEGEHDNLRTALGFDVEQGNAEAGLRLAGALARFWAVRGYLREGREHLARLLALEGAEAHREPRAKALNGAGILARLQSDYRTARACFEESLRIRRELGDRRGIADCLANLGCVARRQSDDEAAWTLYQESVAMYRDLGDQRGLAGALCGMGNVAHRRGADEEAWALYQESLALRQDLGETQGIAECLEGVAAVCGSRGQTTRAARLLGAAESLRDALGVPRPPGEQPAYEQQVTALRAGLSEQALAEAWAEGRRLTLEQAVACVQEEADPV
jgi:predicted ATPase